MTLRVPDPPEASVAALHDSLGALAERGQFGARRLRKARPEVLSAALPHQVFILGLADAAEGALDRAEPSGWRYLIEADQEVVASGETRLEGDNTHTFSHINEGPFVRGTVRALAAAETAANEHEHALEFAVLHIPALYLMSVWLQPDGTSELEKSLFIPIAPAPPGLDADEVYTSEAFSTRIAELARNVPSAATGDPTGGG
jgi:hypothetical protein